MTQWDFVRLHGYGLVVAVGLVVGCATESGSADATGPDERRSSVAVRSVIGDEVIIDGGVAGRGGLGEELAVSPGQHAAQVRVGDAWSAPVEYEVEAGSRATVRIDWSSLPVGRVNDVPVGYEQNVEGESASGDGFSRKDFEAFADVRLGDETPSGRPLVVERVEGIVEHLGFQAGDQIYRAGGEPVDGLDDIVSVIRAASQGQSGELTLLRDGEKVALKFDPKAVSEMVGDEAGGGAGESSARPTERTDSAESGATTEQDGVSRLTVYSKPRGTIVVDGDDTGLKTPRSIEATPGKHRIRVKFQEGDQSEPKTVELEKGDRIKLFFRQ